MFDIVIHRPTEHNVLLTVEKWTAVDRDSVELGLRYTDSLVRMVCSDGEIVIAKDDGRLTFGQSMDDSLAFGYITFWPHGEYDPHAVTAYEQALKRRAASL